MASEKNYPYLERNIVKLLKDWISKKAPVYAVASAFYSLGGDLMGMASAEARFLPVRKQFVSSAKKYQEGKLSNKSYKKEIGNYGSAVKRKNKYLRKAVRDIVDKFDPTLESKAKDALIDKLCNQVIVWQRKQLRNQLNRKLS